MDANVLRFDQPPAATLKQYFMQHQALLRQVPRRDRKLVGGLRESVIDSR